jgi:methyl-accepting chemotaxis protein
MGEVSSPSLEPSEGVAQVRGAIFGMNRCTQPNAALVEQSAAAAEGLNTQAAQLVRAVTAFRLSDSNHLSEMSRA